MGGSYHGWLQFPEVPPILLAALIFDRVSAPFPRVISIASTVFNLFLFLHNLVVNDIKADPVETSSAGFTMRRV